MSSMTTKVHRGELGPFRPCTVQQELSLSATNVPEGWAAWPRGAWIHVTPEEKYIPVQRKSLHMLVHVCIVECMRLPPCFMLCSSIYPPSKPSLPHLPGPCFNSDISKFPCHRQSVKLPDLRPEESKMLHFGKLFPQLHCFCTSPSCRWTQSLLPFCTRLEERPLAMALLSKQDPEHPPPAPSFSHPLPPCTAGLCLSKVNAGRFSC